MAKGELTVQISAILDDYSKELRDDVAKACEHVAKESVKKLKAESPKRTGEYARGWTAKKNGEADWTVYNRTNGQLTHLLESGHVIRNAKGTYGRTNGIPHIKPVEQWANDELVREIERRQS